MMAFLQGIPASEGIAIAKAFRFEPIDVKIECEKVENSTKEVNSFFEALEKTVDELKQIKEHASTEAGIENATIFDAHLLVLRDPELIEPVVDRIIKKQYNAEFAVKEITDHYIHLLLQTENEYLKERAADIKDVANRLQAHLLGIPVLNPAMVAENVIIVSEDLSPSDAALLNPSKVRGAVTNVGGKTSHAAFIAQSLNIPSVVGTKTALGDIENGDVLVVDGYTGIVHINPTPELIEEYEKKQEQTLRDLSELSWLAKEKTISLDKQYFSVVGNIGSMEEAKGVIEHGGEGIGLFRTEFLFMEKKQLPTEEEQFQVYKSVLESLEGKPVVVRTIDIGGDKELPYLKLSKEMNPFLGLRGIRFCLGEQSILRTQLRALIRASAFGTLKIMFPMVAVIEEFRQGKLMFKEECEKLKEEGVEIGHIELGMMVEIPATALMIEAFAKEVDFISIGTNDLIQYTLAADRSNEQVSYLYQPYHPAILRLIKNVIDAAHKEGKSVSICGDMAGNEVAIPLLVGMGLDEFSVHSAAIIKTRAHIRKLNKSEIEKKIDMLLNLPNAVEIEEALENFFYKKL
ncbi:phosphoenolpyruvate--protein phosphotransferase [Cytobacillus sp. Sa5YUA1]|uniref:Phosphoenolpyruvate-protein phosphotransferase n=2 Tax=Bacillaceae TaxID=186817 RepID=A0ABR8QN11_9BACI|nr:phosphoenolpyruvate--protein phosphotransferase [Cytobacillus stercorigallinarum]MBD7936917.1 phosphoenolpyruvate--protein phosphotransferase [Cytobacillus stercorigallinarum]